MSTSTLEARCLTEEERRREMEWYHAAWGAWILAFCALEGYALWRNRRATASNQVWTAFDMPYQFGPDKPTRPSWRTWMGRVGIIAGGTYLIGHFVFGW